MKKYAFIAFIVSVLLAGSGCGNKQEIIPRKDMISILEEIHLMNAAIEVAQYNKDVHIPDTLNVYRLVLNDHQYTRAQFDSSMVHYSEDLKKFDRIYQEVVTRLDKMETQAQEGKQGK